MKKVELEKDGKRQILWADKPLKIGNRCQLKGDDEWYNVTATYQDMEKDKIKRGEGLMIEHTWRKMQSE